MSKESRIKRCKEQLDSFLSLNPREVFERNPQYSDFDGPNLAECKQSLESVLNLLDGLNATETWMLLSWHALSTIDSQLQSCISAYSQLKNSWDQGNWQNFSLQIDGFAYHLRSFGVSHLILDGGRIERVGQEMDAELDKLVTSRIEIGQLRDEVKNLIAPAVAGSLSQAFTARKKILLTGRVIWGVIAFGLGWYCIHATYAFAAAVGDAVIARTDSSPTNNLLWLSVLIRSIVLLPLYAGFGFSFTQYKKERDFEEEYAHKAAVAASLPNYGDLTREPAVRDQIVTGATNVIFAIPTEKAPEREKSDKVLGGLKDVLDSVAKLVPKKE